MTHHPSERIIENEKKIQQAINEFLKGQYPSIRAAAKAYNLNHLPLPIGLKGGDQLPRPMNTTGI